MLSGVLRSPTAVFQNYSPFSLRIREINRIFAADLQIHGMKRGSPDKLGGKILNFPEKVIPLCHE